MPSVKKRLEAAAKKLAGDKALLDRFNALTGEEALAFVRKGPSKPDAAVERLVGKAWKFVGPRECAGDETCECRAKRQSLRALFNEARQSTARECAEIADRAVVSSGVTLGGKAIRARFGLEAK